MEAPAADGETDRALESAKRGAALRGRTGAGLAVRICVVAALVLAIGLRLHSSSPLWLDEALSANIAGLPIPDLVEALRQDGSPPLYYLLLHVWMSAFGHSDASVRSLSVVFAVACLPTIYAVGRRAAGRDAGLISMLLLASCPFAVRYATETRMYAMVMLLSGLWLLALQRCDERPTPARLAMVSVSSAALALTHYWTFFLLAAGGLVLAIAIPGHSSTNRSPELGLAALCSGGILVIPWLPTMMFQLTHTGTPWAQPPGADALAQTLRAWTGLNRGSWVAWCVGLALIGALCLAAPAHPEAPHPSASARRLWARPWSLSVLAIGTLALGLSASRLLSAGFAPRYSAPAVVPAIVAVGFGLRRLQGRLRSCVVASIVILGLLASTSAAHNDRRTQAARTAAAILRGAGPDDLVVYCPDQLGPAVSRLLPADLHQVAYPTLGAPQRVDWIDYQERNAASSPLAAAEAIARQAVGTVWLVMAPGYRTFAKQCEQLDLYLTAFVGARTLVQRADKQYFEQQSLLRYDVKPLGRK